MGVEYDDVGTVRLEKGSAAYQPSSVRRTEVAHGHGAVIVEVVTGA